MKSPAISQGEGDQRGLPDADDWRTPDMSMNKGNEERRQALLALADSLKARHEQAFDDAYTVDFPEAIRSLANAIEDIEQALRAIAQEAGDE